MSIVTDINELHDAGQLDSPEVTAYLAQHPDLPVLIDKDCTVYHPATAAQRPLMELRRFLWKRKHKAKFQSVLDTVFDSYIKERSTAGKTVDPNFGVARATDLLELAVSTEASDIHFEARREGATILFRVHGVMRVMAENIGFEEAQRLIQTYYVNSQYANTTFDPMSPCDGQFNFIDPKTNKTSPA